CMQSIDYPWTF
nr:immunoglobulin light chain junction region [Macaca mulatta]MOW41449.1 immunoglobulin light chain junction region [Macaca mulatta]MOW41609.1 immunoglobulin light chain junction region [Macaca mulatta]MOW42468.1 immunoglobulin light chain junction region [Macaca mulatta]MOW42779.1 immunoglobulin light chain junction region [Macaca mulatta]